MDWLTQGPYTRMFMLRVLLKTLFLFAACNILFAIFEPLPLIGELSLYNTVFRPRDRLPFSNAPEKTYSLTVCSLSAGFSSHKVDRQKQADEFRVFIFGDSSIWAYELESKDTLSEQLNALELYTADGKRVMFYNLSHPFTVLSKDLLLIDEAMQYEPDMMLWFLTPRSLMHERQTLSYLVSCNPDRFNRLIETYDLDLEPLPQAESFYDRTLIGKKLELAEIWQLQLDGVLWQTTGIDYDYYNPWERLPADQTDNLDTLGMQPDKLENLDLLFDILEAGVQRAEGIPIWIINQPMFIGTGQNSDLRYNSYYARWFYDDYRAYLQNLAQSSHWCYKDFWDVVAPEHFIRTALHLSPEGVQQLIPQIIPLVDGTELCPG